MCWFHFQFCSICTIIMINLMIFSFNIWSELFSFIPKPQLSFFEPCNIFFHLNSVPKWKCFTLYALCEKKYVCIIEYKAIHTCILFVYMFNAGLIQNFIILARMQTKLFIFHTIKRPPKMFGIKRIKLCWNIYKHVHVLKC